MSEHFRSYSTLAKLDFPELSIQLSNNITCYDKLHCQLSISCYGVIKYTCSLYVSSGRGFCGTVTPVPALQLTGPHQTLPPYLVVSALPRIALLAVPDREHGAYAPSRISSLRCHSCIRSGAAGTPPVPSPSWWTASVLQTIFYCHFHMFY